MPRRDVGEINPQVGAKIQKARKFHRPPLTREELADRVKKGSSTIGMYENGIRRVPEEIVSRIADALNIPIEWFYDGLDTMPPDAMPKFMEQVGTSSNVEIIEPTQGTPQITLVPYWGVVPAGDWEMPNNDVGTIQISDRWQEIFPDLKGIIAVRAMGNSMLPRIHSGQVVPIRLSPEKKDGVVTLAKNGHGELTLKLLVYTPKGWELHSFNPAYGNVSAEECVILGHAIGLEEVAPEGLRA